MAKQADKLAEKTSFLRKNWQIIYAILLIILVPVTIVLNTLFVVDRFRTTVDAELQRTALIIGKMVNVTSVDLFDDTQALQQRIQDVAEVIPEVRSLDLLTYDKEIEDFVVSASLDAEAIGQVAHGTQNILSRYTEQSIAYLTRSPRAAGLDQRLTAEEARSDARYWGVIMPMYDAEGELQYLLSSKISLEVIDNLVKSNLFWSYAWLGVTVLIVILILASNTRLFQYAILFKKLKEVDKMKDDFISMASHELRAPITAIRGYLSLFLEDAFGPMGEKPKEIMKTTFGIATHLGSLVEDLLDVSRIEQGRMKFDLEVVGVGETIEEVIRQLHFEAEKKGLVFEFKKPEVAPPLVRVDLARLRQVLINICSNAIKYTETGSVTVTTIIDEAGMLEIKVTDTGLGMNPEQRERLFTKFYRIKTDQTRDIPGTGLGLWITKRIVELMGGKIFVDSIEKVGTQVSVLLPIPKSSTKGAVSSDNENSVNSTESTKDSDNKVEES
jgi:signal transduction histidine kinase